MEVLVLRFLFLATARRPWVYVIEARRAGDRRRRRSVDGHGEGVGGGQLRGTHRVDAALAARRVRGILFLRRLLPRRHQRHVLL